MAVDTLIINNFEPPPKTNMYVAPGIMSTEWERWFYNLFLRVGGTSGADIYDTVNASAPEGGINAGVSQDALINNAPLASNQPSQDSIVNYTPVQMPQTDIMALIDAGTSAAIAFVAQNPMAPLTQYLASTAAQSVFNLSIPVYSILASRAYTIVVVNGGIQIEGVDFNITGAQQITFTTALNLGDDVVIYAWAR